MHTHYAVQETVLAPETGLLNQVPAIVMEDGQAVSRFQGFQGVCVYIYIYVYIRTCNNIRPESER